MNANDFKDLRSARYKLEWIIQELGLENKLAKRLDDEVMKYLNRLHLHNRDGERNFKIKEDEVFGITRINENDSSECTGCHNYFEEYEILFYSENADDFYCADCKEERMHTGDYFHERVYIT